MEPTPRVALPSTPLKPDRKLVPDFLPAVADAAAAGPVSCEAMAPSAPRNDGMRVTYAVASSTPATGSVLSQLTRPAQPVVHLVNWDRVVAADVLRPHPWPGYGLGVVAALGPVSRPLPVGDVERVNGQRHEVFGQAPHGLIAVHGPHIRGLGAKLL